MLKAYEDGRVIGTGYYGATSADVQANYLVAYSHAGSKISPNAASQASKLLAELKAKAVRKGDCMGWGIGTALDAFGDGSVDPADTIFLYSSSRVILAKSEAVAAGFASQDNAAAKEEACSLKSLFDFDPKVPRLRYSDNKNDDGYLVFNVFADMSRAAMVLDHDISDPALVTLAKDACRVLSNRVGPDGYVPYFEGRSDTDPTHHAMVTVGLYSCVDRFGMDSAAATRAADYLLRNYVGVDGGKIAPQSHQEWVVGEGLRAITDACKHDTKYCAAVDFYLKYVVEHEKDGLVNNNDLRFQSWLAGGLSYALQNYQKPHAS